jgi:hypothetical protein
MKLGRPFETVNHRLLTVEGRRDLDLLMKTYNEDLYFSAADCHFVSWRRRFFEFEKLT